MKIEDIPVVDANPNLPPADVLAASRELRNPAYRPTPSGWPDEAWPMLQVVVAWIRAQVSDRFVGTKMDARAIESVRHVANELVAFLIPWACAHITVDQAARSVRFTIMPNPTLPFADRERIDAAIDLAVRYGGIEGDHHKAWVIDQMVRALAGERYAEIVRDAKFGDDGPETYDWDEGIPP